MTDPIPTRTTQTLLSVCARWPRRIGMTGLPALLALMFGTSLGLAQTPALKAIRITSHFSGIPVTVNGTVRATPFTVNVNPSAPLALSVPSVFDRGDGFRFTLESWVVRNQGSRPDDSFATAAISLPNTLDTASIELVTAAEVRFTVNVSGPGTVVRDPPASPDGFIPFLTLVALTPVADANAYFAGWDTPWGHRDGPLDAGRITVPVTVTAHFGERVTPPPAFFTESAFPDLRFGTSDPLVEGQVTLQSPVPMRVRDVEVLCEPYSLIFGTTLSSYSTPLLIRAALGPENNYMPEGLHSCAIVVHRYDGEPAYRIPFRVRIGQEEPETPPAVAVNGASFVKMPLAPGAIFSLFGESLGVTTEKAQELPLPQSLGRTRVRIRSGSGDTDAPLFYVSPNQINFLVPLDLPIGQGTLEILREGTGSVSIPVSAEWQAPALFAADSTGSGPPAGYYMRVRGDEQVRGEFVHCPDGKHCVPVPIASPDPAEEVYLVLFGTGFRNAPSLVPQVRMGDAVAEASYFGAHRDFAGLDQINVKVPRPLLGKGALPVSVIHGAKQSNTVTIAF